MNLFEAIFGKKKRSAEAARDRLKIMLAHERVHALPYIEDLKKDIIEVVKKYAEVNDIKIKTEKNQDIDFLEVEIILNSPSKG